MPVTPVTPMLFPMLTPANDVPVRLQGMPVVPIALPPIVALPNALLSDAPLSSLSNLSVPMSSISSNRSAASSACMKSTGSTGSTTDAEFENYTEGLSSMSVGTDVTGIVDNTEALEHPVGFANPFAGTATRTATAVIRTTTVPTTVVDWKPLPEDALTEPRAVSLLYTFGICPLVIYHGRPSDRVLSIAQKMSPIINVELKDIFIYSPAENKKWTCRIFISEVAIFSEYSNE
jgi:hypothetical protein